jgi:uncharacterized protein (DUF58 family)
MPIALKSAGAVNVGGVHDSAKSGKAWFRISEIWARFLLAILGLGLAFGAALFSTVTRESGNLWATLLLASLALILAVVVGLTTVPYLARRVAVARIRNVFDYDVTRAGIIYVVIIVVIGIAALNTGNNLLYIIVAAMLAAILCSGVASALVLRSLQLEVRVPAHVFAGKPALARIILRNQARWLPSFSISVVAARRSRAKKQWKWETTRFSFPAGRSSEKQWFAMPDRKLRLVAISPAAPEIFQGPAYFPFLPAHSEQAADVKLCFERRGRYQQESFGLATRFPFAFLVKTRRVPLAREILVYPSIDPTSTFFEILPLINGEIESWQQGRGSGLYRIREYTQEDSARHVDWKASAKSGSLKVREFAREDQRKLRIVFDNPGPNAVSEKDYERAIALAASLGWHFAGENAEVSFATQKFEGEDVHKFLSHMSVVQPANSPSCLEGLPISTSYNIVITSQPRGTIPANLWACSYFIFIGGQNPA